MRGQGLVVKLHGILAQEASNLRWCDQWISPREVARARSGSAEGSAERQMPEGGIFHFAAYTF
jgi:hypothetical protein